MIAKVLAVAASAAALVSASPVPPEPVYVHFTQVAQVLCVTSRGTAFRAGGKWISVEHVTKGQGCFVENKPIGLGAVENGLDFSVIGPAKYRGLKINCEGFKAGEYYWAAGYAEGLPVQRLITLQGTGEHDTSNGMAILYGSPTVIPGMSGGAVMNSAGEVVGTVNMYARFLPLSMSRELKDTSLCKSSDSARR